MFDLVSTAEAWGLEWLGGSYVFLSEAVKQLQQIHILFEYVAAYEKEVFVWAGPRRGGSSLIVTEFLTDECESLILN